MLLPDNIHPKYSIYYNGSIVLSQLELEVNQPIFALYQRVKKINDMSFATFMLSLDWLYIIDMAKINDDGCVELCS